MTPILLDHVAAQGTLLTEKIAELRDQFSVVVSGSTGVGLLQKIQLTDQRFITPFHLKCRNKGLIMAPDLVLTPALTVSADEILAAADVMADALLEMQEEET
jgi:acetylornithine/succinyldiaminopimelate/putrescine aminotransferase